MGLIRTALASPAVAKITSPHTPDDYLSVLHPMLTVNAVRGKVVSVTAETGSASTVLVKPNRTWQGFKPGQHIEFGVEVEGTRRVRVFSVSSSAMRTDGLISVSVKAHPDGYVSQFLHAGHLKPGTVVFLSPAAGDFTLPRRVPAEILLISGGSGITPVMSMLRTLADQKHRGLVTFLHYARSVEDEMFTAELDELAGLPFVRMVRVYTREPQTDAKLVGRITLDHLNQLGIEPAKTPTWVCGPAGLIQTVTDLYGQNGAAEQLTAEFFKVPSVDLSAADATGTVSFESSNCHTENSGSTILEQAEAAGLKPQYGCRMGVCNTCAVKKLHGAVRHVISGEVNANTDETIKVCVNVPVGDVAVEL